MKVKLYEILRMLWEDELIDGERVIIGNNLYCVDLNQKKFLLCNDKTMFRVFYSDVVGEECELIDRK